MSGGVETKMSVGEVRVSSIMEVEEKELTSESLTYQPQVDLEPAETLTELKPVKQSVTYDSQTGKMYAELGTSNTERGVSLGPEYSFQYSGPQYQQTYSVPGLTPQYSAPPYTTTYTSPPSYDRLNTTTTSYPFNSPAAPTAFLPHSAINLSVKTEESSGQGDPSPQILDLTRPLSGTPGSPSLSFSTNTSLAPPPDSSLGPAKVQTEPVDFSSSQPAPFTAGRVFEPPGRERSALLPPSLTEGSVLGGGMAGGGQDTSLSRYRGGSGGGGGYTTSLPLPSPYDTICSSYPASPYPPYQQSTYSCLTPYPPTSFPTVPYQDPLSLAYTTASLSSTIPSPDSCIKPELG